MARTRKRRKAAPGEARPADRPATEPAPDMSAAAGGRFSFDFGAYLRSGAWIYPLLLIVFMAVMAYIRIVPAYGNVFPGWDGGYVNVAADDAVMQMRLVHNTLAHFPGRIMFDPFTNYPFGSQVHFGPLFTLIIASAALIVGLGSPSPQLVDTVGAYIPVLLGVLCILPVYFTGKKLFGRNAGIVAAATLALLPGQFLARSMLGFTDHHIAEVLFSATTVTCLAYALDAARKSGLSPGKIKSGDRQALAALGYSALAGAAFGCYLLVWPGALLVGFILFLYFVAQAVIDHFRNVPLDDMIIVAAVLYLIPVLMVLPYSLQDPHLDLMYYSLTQPVFLCLALAGIAAVYVVSRVLKRRKAEAWSFPVALSGTAVAGLIGAYLAVPELFALAMAGFKVFAPGGGMLTVAEARPTIFNAAGQLDLSMLWSCFFWTLPVSVVAIAMLAFRTFRNNRPAELLVLSWSLVMLWATCSQIRFTYYFAVNAALLTGYFAVATFRAFGSEEFLDGFRKKAGARGDLRAYASENAGAVMLFGAMGIIFLWIMVYPITSLSVGGSSLSPGGYTMAVASGNAGLDSDWFNALTWLRDHTPDPQGSPVRPGFDYANGTYAEAFGADGTWAGYPASAYGVMSWWDYGHDIEYVAQRIPNANPFQEGIVVNGSDGSAPFFLSTNESDAYRNLQELGSRYVMIDDLMTTGKFPAIETWAGDTRGWLQPALLNVSGYSIPIITDSAKFRDSMASRLYYDDCDGMSHFRLVYQSPGSYYVTTKVAYLSGYQSGSGYVPFAFRTVDPFGNYSEDYGFYQDSVGPMAVGGSAATLVYDSRPPAKEVKTYQVVPGATITGTATAGDTVNASITLGIEDRTFDYTQTTIADANGTYSMIVPYATTAMNGTGYSSDVRPLSNYTISNGNTTKTAAVPETAVMSGETINIS